MPRLPLDRREGPPPPAAPHPAPGRRTRPGSTRKAAGFITALLLVMVGGGALAGFLMKSAGGGAVTPQEIARATAPPPTGRASQPLPASNRELMGLETLSAAQAPGFTLTDQHGKTISLAQMDRSHVVVLAFMDDRCTDICPIVGREIAGAYHDLGSRASSVEFLSVNVNAAHNSVGWLRAFIARQAPELSSIPNFHYLTGPVSTLKKIWSSYHITVKIDPTSSRVFHSEGMYFIAPGGGTRYQATPFANQRKNGTGWLPKATISQWSRGIAQYAKAAAGQSAGKS